MCSVSDEHGASTPTQLSQGGARGALTQGRGHHSSISIDESPTKVSHRISTDLFAFLRSHQITTTDKVHILSRGAKYEYGTASTSTLVLPRFW